MIKDNHKLFSHPLRYQNNILNSMQGTPFKLFKLLTWTSEGSGQETSPNLCHHVGDSFGAWYFHLEDTSNNPMYISLDYVRLTKTSRIFSPNILTLEGESNIVGIFIYKHSSVKRLCSRPTIFSLKEGNSRPLHMWMHPPQHKCLHNTGICLMTRASYP